MMVPKSTPNATDIAIGIKNCAWKLFSNINGNSPTNVVIVVSIGVVVLSCCNIIWGYYLDDVIGRENFLSNKNQVVIFSFGRL